jgi:hypothetical protein
LALVTANLFAAIMIKLFKETDVCLRFYFAANKFAVTGANEFANTVNIARFDSQDLRVDLILQTHKLPTTA